MLRFVFAMSLVMTAGASLSNRAMAERPASEEPHYRSGIMLGGSLVGTVEEQIDGRRAATPDGTQLDGALDLRGYVSWLPRRWFALSVAGGLTNWQSSYLTNAGHGRSNFFPLGVGAEVRIPFGRCRRCPSLFLGEWASVALSQRDQRAPYLRVREHGRLGVGGLWSFAGAMDFPFRGRTGLRIQVAFERAVLHHWVELSGVGTQHERYDIRRGSVTVGPWIAL